jgi:hypothetical protein
VNLFGQINSNAPLAHHGASPMNKLDNFREQIENVIAFTVWLGVIGYVVVTFWLNHKMPDFEAPTWNLKIPAETFITPYLLLWAAMERMVANVNPDGWLKGFWQGLDRWRGIGTAIFMVVTLTLAVEKSEVSYLAVLIGIAGYALFDAYDNWSRGMGIASTAGVPRRKWSTA